KAKATIKLDDKVKGGRERLIADEPLTIVHTGGDVQARVRRTWLPAPSGDRVASLKNGFIVQRSMTVIPKDGSPSTRKEDVKAAERTLKLGDIVEIHATMTTDVARNNVAFTVPFAAGFEPLNPEL